VWPGHIGGGAWVAVVGVAGAQLEGMGSKRSNGMGDRERKFIH